MQVKVKYKDTGKISYLDEVRKTIGYRYKELSNGKRIPYPIVEVYYYESPDSTIEISKDTFDVIPQTCYELFGVECGVGWNQILTPLFRYIEEYNKDKDETDHIVILQVKEKFGGLRFYTSGETEELRQMIRDAEEQSYKTCELCGSTEDVGRTTGWITTCCRKCAEQMRNVQWIDQTGQKYTFKTKKP